MKPKIKDENKRRLARRAFRIRKRVEGSAERPRLAVFRSAKHIYAQIIDDTTATTLVAASTRTKELAEALKGLKKSQKAEKVGAKVAELAKQKGIEAVVFDRAGRPFHGRLAALAKGAREAGLKF
jgi:large subunit ribosomal protein L18